MVNDSDPEVGNGPPSGAQLWEKDNVIERAVVVISGKGKGSEADRDVVMLVVMWLPGALAVVNDVAE